MSTFAKAKTDPKALLDFIEKCEREFDEGKERLKVRGALQQEAADQPAWLGYYDETRAELKALRDHFESKAKRIRASFYKEYMENYNRVLQKQDIEQYINNEPKWQSADDLHREISMLYDKFEGLVEAFKAKGWALSHIVKLRCNALEDALI